MPQYGTEVIPLVERRIFGNAVAVNISVTNHQFSRPGCLYAGVAGNIVVDVAGIGTQVTFKGVGAGTILPVFVTRVYKSNTTATDMLMLE